MNKPNEPASPKPDAPRSILDAMEAKIKEDEKNNQARYFIFSTTILIEGIRMFCDMPVSGDIRFPTRKEIFKFTCERYNKEMNEELFNSFAVLNIHEFESKIDFETFLK